MNNGIKVDEVLKLFEGKLVEKGSTRRKKPMVKPSECSETDSIMRPKEIFKKLSVSVFGQEQAKRSLSVLLYEHLLRRRIVLSGQEKSKTNALLVGPSGSGKTFIAKSMADIAGVPFLRLDATSFVQRGYRGGMHTETIVDLVFNNIRLKADARFSIIFIDEIDKLARLRYCDEGDLATTGVQEDLLHLIDGGDRFYESDNERFNLTKFSFKDILFIFAGAFEKQKSQINDTRDLMDYGFIPEFAGRMGNIIKTDTISDEVLKGVIEKAVIDYADYIDIKFEQIPVYCELILSMVKANGLFKSTGARCIYPAVRKFFEDRLFEM